MKWVMGLLVFAVMLVAVPSAQANGVRSFLFADDGCGVVVPQSFGFSGGYGLGANAFAVQQFRVAPVLVQRQVFVQRQFIPVRSRVVVNVRAGGFRFFGRVR